MSANSIKGALLEYIVREILLNCGFKRVEPDNVYIYNQNGLTFINGKGGAHDGDVLMDPPMQMPFSYPSRLCFECKAYNKKIGLTIVRNALGLRADINDFEIVTRRHIVERRNRRRTTPAIVNRERFYYQVGVASIEDFTKDAFEFASNSKIPLISLRWLFPGHICELFHRITDATFLRYEPSEVNNLMFYLKGNQNQPGERFAHQANTPIREIIAYFREFKDNVLIGLLESGDMLFLVSEGLNEVNGLRNEPNLTGRYHFGHNDPETWTLRINDMFDLTFFLPERISRLWEEQSLSAQAAANIKENLFSRVFIFGRNFWQQELPFRVVRIDGPWLQGLIRSFE